MGRYYLGLNREYLPPWAKNWESGWYAYDGSHGQVIYVEGALEHFKMYTITHDGWVIVRDFTPDAESCTVKFKRSNTKEAKELVDKMLRKE